MKYHINKGQFLSDVLPEIKSNTILSKKITGIGATHLEITTPKHSSIILVPNVPVIESKCAKHKDLFGVHEGVTVNQVIEYLKSRKDLKRKDRFKLMTTPESFSKIKKACKAVGINLYEEFFFSIDECHKLIKDVGYREDIVLPMDDFFQFKRKALISATPLEFSDLRFLEQGFKTVSVEANYDCKQQIRTLHTNNIFQSVKKMISERGMPICLFVNSVEIAHSLIAQLGIVQESVIFCSPKSRLKLKNELKFENAHKKFEADKMQPFSFFTGRFFNAFDLELDYKPNVIMLTDAYTQYTMLDVHTDCVQIAGRFRNGLKSLTHIYNTDWGIVPRDKGELELELYGHERVCNTIKTFYNNASTEGERRAFGEALRILPFNKFLYNGKKNYFAIDNYIDDVLIQNCYQNSETLEDQYLNSDMFIPFFTACKYSVTDFEQLQIISSSLTIREKRIKMVEMLEKFQEPYSEEAVDTIYYIRSVDKLLMEAYETLGKEGIKEANYSERGMREAMILNKKMGSKTIRLIHNSFKVGFKYTNKEIEEELSRIYGLLEIHPSGKISGKMIKDFFRVEPCKKRGERGYYLISPLV